MAYVGVDACKGGWIAVILRDGEASTQFVEHIEDLPMVVPSILQIAIDIPIGFAGAQTRKADVAAKKFLGRRSSTVFFVPPRAVVQAPTYEAAARLSREIMGVGLSRPSYGLRNKILEVDQWLVSAPCPVSEAHPEISFAALLGSPVATSKKTWAGMVTRRAALQSIGIGFENVPEEVGRRAAVDDLLDAGILAWTALRIWNGEAISFPDPPDVDPDGRAIAIRA